MKRLLWGVLLLAGCKAGGNRAAVERSVGAVTEPRPVSRPRWEGPDPAVLNVKWGPMALAPGAGGTVEVDVVNRGEQPFGPCRVGVYATLGRVVTAKKTLLGSAEVQPPQGGPRRVVVPYTAPATAGSYAVDVELDDLRQVQGDDPTNNRSASATLLVR